MHRSAVRSFVVESCGWQMPSDKVINGGDQIERGYCWMELGIMKLSQVHAAVDSIQSSMLGLGRPTRWR